LNSGIGFDIHPLVPGRKLVLGGVEIPYEKGLDGWSDADVLTHAIIDALLGAAALGDIGRHFPPGDTAYKDICSLVLLARTVGKLSDNSWRVNNVDAIIIAEKPRLMPYIEEMRKNLSESLGIHVGQVSVKASTANTVGPIGHSEAIATIAIATVEKTIRRGRKNENI
jgi:2-C-methyl-D-erythritol 2,4-cyclodiphosphate synthase